MFVIYREDGNITKIVGAPDAEVAKLQLSDGEYLLETQFEAMDDEHWVEHATGEIHAKLDYPLENLPMPCVVNIEGVEYHCTEQPEFEFDAPGTYIITVDAGPRYLKKEFRLENTPLLA